MLYTIYLKGDKITASTPTEVISVLRSRRVYLSIDETKAIKNAKAGVPLTLGGANVTVTA